MGMVRSVGAVLSWTVGLAALLGCAGAGDARPVAPGEPLTRLEQGDTLPAITRPAAFGGTLPCADCAGIETTIILHPDGSYRVRDRYVGEKQPDTFVRLGRWAYRADSLPRLTLYGGPDGPRHFAVTGALTLRALDREGNAIESTQPLDLRRISAPPSLGRDARLRGEFRYFADAATLVECASGRQFPVTGDSAFIRLQRAHQEQHLGTGAAILVDATGAFETRPGMEEGTELETFVVESFEVQPPRASCEASRVRALIAVGDWQLRALDGEALPELPRELQPTLRFVLSEPTMFGNAGCNRFTGRAVLRGLDLVPATLALTMRACVDSLANVREARYGAALGAGGYFRADGNTLIYATGGTERARFERR